MEVPRIACFHGGGSNSAVFAAQCKRLAHALAGTYDLVFFDAPYERAAGPGVLPHFADLAPFRTWMQPAAGIDATAARSDHDEDEEEPGLVRVLKLMHADTLRRRRAARAGGDAAATEPGRWVAAMGFSQGTRVVGGLLRRQQQRRRRQRRAQHLDDPFGVELEFGILCMGSASPMGWFDEAETSSTSSACIALDTDKAAPVLPIGGQLVVEDNDVIAIPTLHLHGLRDPILPKSRDQLAAYYDLGASHLLEINYHHAMPWYTQDLMDFVLMIKSTHKRARMGV
ncbi:putative esterase afoC [Lasiodiplodia hormozganensis]|uniref:Esterase afoC n=1 Tax=Lasiodiplodia hormozganensis TaxID=869390 RepID=A0AA39XU27_9PEZI|nr:putative esterase afoC [Lasiodiplodia hormozganensis]